MAYCCAGCGADCAMMYRPPGGAHTWDCCQVRIVCG